jgi:hypothetical protein
LGEVGAEDLGFGFWIGLGGQDGVVAGGVMTKDELVFWGGLDAEALGADGDAAIVSDFDDGAFAPDEGPPRTTRDGSNGRVFFFSGDVPGLLGFQIEFALEFVLVAMQAQSGDVCALFKKKNDLEYATLARILRAKSALVAILAFILTFRF